MRVISLAASLEPVQLPLPFDTQAEPNGTGSNEIVEPESEDE